MIIALSMKKTRGRRSKSDIKWNSAGTLFAKWLLRGRFHSKWGSPARLLSRALPTLEQFVILLKKCQIILSTTKFWDWRSFKLAVIPTEIDATCR